jgi:hypothetical protein
MSNNFERLKQATLCLSQDGPLKERLAEAWASHLEAVECDALPESLRGEFRALCDAMHRVTPEVRESAVRASVRKMSVLEAREHAALVVRVFAAMAQTEAVPAALLPRGRVAAVRQLHAAEG